MNLEDLGNLGELLAALATLATLLYLAAQVRQNTRAVKSATFENITSEMGKNLEPIMSSGELSEIIIKGTTNPDSLNSEETLRLTCLFVSSFRKLESVFVQNRIGIIEDELTKGFERSVLGLLDTEFGHRWWKTAKATFYGPFSEHIDQQLSDRPSGTPHPSVAIQGNR